MAGMFKKGKEEKRERRDSDSERFIHNQGKTILGQT
jgi:hypothetical protein